MRSRIISIKIWVVALLLIIISPNIILAQQLFTKENEQIDFAQQLLYKGQYKLAVSEYEEVIQLYPQSLLLETVYIGLGDGYFFLKDYQKAINCYKNLMEKFPNGKYKGLALLRWGQSLYLKGDVDGALTKLMTVDVTSIQKPLIETLYFFLGQVFMSQKNFKDAIINFEKATQNEKSGGYTTESYILWGNALVQEFDYKGAIDKYTKALEFATTDDVKFQILMSQAQAFFLTEQYDVAAKMYKNIVDNYSLVRGIKDAVTNWYVTLLRNKQYDKLIAFYNDQFKDNFQDSSFASVHLSAVEAHIVKGENNDALAILDRFLSIPNLDDKDKNISLLKKTTLLIKLGRFRESIVFIDLQNVVDKDTKGALILLKAEAYLDLKDYDQAWASYVQVLQDFPDKTTAYCGQAHIRFAQGKNDESVNLFMDCFTKSKDDSLKENALYNVFYVYQQSNTKDKAIETAELFKNQFPHSQLIFQLILSEGDIYSKDQKYEQAIAVLKPLLEVEDDSIKQQAYFKVAYNYQLFNNLDEALKNYTVIINGSANAEVKFYAYKNVAYIYLQKKDEDMAAENLDWIAHNFPPNDLTIKNYLWLAEHWQIKNNPKRMTEVLLEAQKRPAQLSESLGIEFFMAEANRLDNKCSINMYDDVIKAKEENLYKGRAYLGKGMCLFTSGNIESAQKAFEDALSNNSQDNFVAMRARFEMAHLLEIQKDLNKAAKLYMLVALLYKDPEYSPKALMRAGEILQNLNENTEALTAYHQILDDYPQSSFVSKAKEFVETIK